VMIRGRGAARGRGGSAGRGRGAGRADTPAGVDEDEDRDEERMDEETNSSSLATKEPPPTYPPIFAPGETKTIKKLSSKDSFVARQATTIQKGFQNSPYFLQLEPPKPEIETWFCIQKGSFKRKKPSEEIQFSVSLCATELLPEDMRPKKAPKQKKDKTKKVFADLQAGERDEALEPGLPDDHSKEDEDAQDISSHEEDSGSIESQDEEDDKWKQNDDDDEGADDDEDKADDDL